jgi:hypothetical protein
VLVLSQTVGTASALGFFVGVQRGLRFGAPQSVVHNLQMPLHVFDVLHLSDTVGQLSENLLGQFGSFSQSSLPPVHTFGDHPIRILVGISVDFAVLPKLSAHFKGQGELKQMCEKEKSDEKKLMNKSKFKIHYLCDFLWVANQVDAHHLAV